MCFSPVQVLSTRESEQCTVHPAQPPWRRHSPLVCRASLTDSDGKASRRRARESPQGCSALLLLKTRLKRWRESSLRCNTQKAPSKDHIQALNERSGQSYKLENPTLQVKDHKWIGFPSHFEAFNIHPKLHILCVTLSNNITTLQNIPSVFWNHAHTALKTTAAECHSIFEFKICNLN